MFCRGVHLGQDGQLRSRGEDDQSMVGIEIDVIQTILLKLWFFAAYYCPMSNINLIFVNLLHLLSEKNR